VAIIKLGSLISGISGSVGGATFSNSRSGPFVRPWSRGSNPRSTKQSLHRSRVATLSASWRALTDLQRAAWNIWAVLPAQNQTNYFGDTFSLSGFGWWCKAGIRLLEAGRSTIIAPPSAGYPAAPTISSFNPFSTATGNSNFRTPADEFLAYDCFLFLALSQSSSVENPGNNYALIKIWNLQAGDWFAFQPQLNEAFGTIQVGHKLHARIYRQSTEGLRSPVATIATVVAS